MNISCEPENTSYNTYVSDRANYGFNRNFKKNLIEYSNRSLLLPLHSQKTSVLNFIIGVKFESSVRRHVYN